MGSRRERTHRQGPRRSPAPAKPARPQTARPQPRRKPPFARCLRWAGDDPDREGLLDTPARVARSYRELFAGYDTDPRTYLERTFEEVAGYDQLVVLKDIRVVSCCEHHMLPVIGRAHVAYLPRDRVVGISKLSRVVNGFARRLQIQEKLTAEIANAIQEVLNPLGVGRCDRSRTFVHDSARCEYGGVVAGNERATGSGSGRHAYPHGVHAPDPARRRRLSHAPPSDRHGHDFFVCGDDLISHGHHRFQALLGGGDRGDDVDQLGLALGVSSSSEPSAAREDDTASPTAFFTRSAKSGPLRAAAVTAGRGGDGLIGGGGVGFGGDHWTDHGSALRSAFQDVEGAALHGARGLDHVQICLVGALGLAHIERLGERINVRHLHVAL